MSDVTEEPREPKPEDNEPTRPLPPLTTQPTPKPLPGRTDDLPDGLIAVGVIAALVLLFVVAAWGIPKAVDWARTQDWHQLTQWAATIDQPVHGYLAAHTIGLPITATTAYALWQAIGAGSLLVSVLTGSVGARLTWTCWGAGSVAMVWSQTPATGREVATGLAVLAWTAASTLALRGLSLRPVLAG